ncbi:MAG: hypothetical protein R3F16_23575 [Myxococcota bacterium]
MPDRELHALETLVGEEEVLDRRVVVGEVDLAHPVPVLVGLDLGAQTSASDLGPIGYAPIGRRRVPGRVADVERAVGVQTPAELERELAIGRPGTEALVVDGDLGGRVVGAGARREQERGGQGAEGVGERTGRESGSHRLEIPFVGSRRAGTPPRS